MRNVSGTRPRLGMAIVLEKDDVAMGRVLAGALQSVGYRTVIAGTVAEARALLSNGKVDLVLVDLGLDEGFGVELLIELCETPDAPTTVIVSDYDLASIIAARFGVPLVEKPFAIEVLLHTVDDARRHDLRPRRARGR
jgi:DNA-binding response OmpR family regulator